MNLINNFLDPDTVMMLETICGLNLDWPVQDSNQSKWLPGLVRQSERIDLIDLDGDIADKIKTEILGKLKQIQDTDTIAGLKWEIGLHIGRAGSYIAWHSDDENAVAMTVYLNRVWDPNWGGWFLFKLEDDQLVQGVLPQHNLGLVYEPPLMHSVVLATPDAPPRLSLQIFVTKAKVG